MCSINFKIYIEEDNIGLKKRVNRNQMQYLPDCI